MLRSLLATCLAALTIVAALPAVAQRPRRDEARRAAETRAVARALERAEQALTGGHGERALARIEAVGRRVPRDPRPALRACEILVPESDEMVEAWVADPEGVARAAARCEALLLLHEGAADGAPVPEVADRHAWARALGGDRAPALARLTSRRLDERDLPALRRLTVLGLRAGDLESGEAALELARRIRPGDLDVVGELAAVRLARGDAASAVALFRSVVAGRPGDRDALHDLAGACLQAGETAVAVRHYEALAAAEPTDGARWLELALARVELGAYARAATDARRAVELLLPEDPRGALALGDALRLGGDAVGARGAYEDALRRDPGSVRARRALAALDEH